MKLILTILALSLSSCVPKAIVVAPIAPRAVAVHEKVARAKASAETLKVTVLETHEQAKGIAAEAVELKSEADRLSKKPTLTLEDWELFKALADTHSRNAWAHEIKTAQIVDQSNTLQADSVAAEKESAELVTHAVTTDKQTSEIVTKNESLKEDAGKWKALRRIFIFGTVLILVLLGIYAYLRFLTPRL